MKSLNILVTDGQWRKALATVRSLGKKGHNITVIGDSLLTTSFFSRYCNKKIILPSLEKNKEKFLTSLLTLLKNNKYHIIIPLEDDTIELFLKHREKIEKYSVLPLAPKNLFELFRDKAKTFELAKQYNIPHPKTYIFKNLQDFKEKITNLSPPLIIKPCKSSGSRGLVKITRKEDLYDSYINIHKKYNLPIIQEFIPDGGKTQGVSILLDKAHNLVGSFVHERVREYPVSGGPSTLRKSVINHSLTNISVRFLQTIKWIGFAMLEFKEDPRDGKFKLIEVNPRFVGSLQLAISSGVDFPNLLIDSFVLKKYTKVINYKENIFCRWLLPGDILHFINNPERFKLNPSFFKFFDKNLYYDILDFNDPLPVLGRLLVIIKEAFNPASWQKYILKKK